MWLPLKKNSHTPKSHQNMGSFMYLACSHMSLPRYASPSPNAHLHHTHILPLPSSHPFLPLNGSLGTHGNTECVEEEDKSIKCLTAGNCHVHPNNWSCPEPIYLRDCLTQLPAVWLCGEFWYVTGGLAVVADVTSTFACFSVRWLCKPVLCGSQWTNRSVGVFLFFNLYEYVNPYEQQQWHVTISHLAPAQMAVDICVHNSVCVCTCMQHHVS